MSTLHDCMIEFVRLSRVIGEAVIALNNNQTAIIDEVQAIVNGLAKQVEELRKIAESYRKEVIRYESVAVPTHSFAKANPLPWKERKTAE